MIGKATQKQLALFVGHSKHHDENLRLKIILRIPIAVKNDYNVGSCKRGMSDIVSKNGNPRSTILLTSQIQPKTSCTRTQQHYKAITGLPAESIDRSSSGRRRRRSV
jgi:hypothetical protein